MNEQKNQTLPRYTLGEELLNAISHGIGALLSILGTIFFCIYGVHRGALTLVSLLLFGGAMTVTYTISCVYHALARNAGKRVLRVLDHCFIFTLIIGTYAPFSLAAIGGVRGWILFGTVLAAGIVGITLNAVSLKKFKIFSMICYIAMGWAVIFMMKPLIAALPPIGLWLLLGGGISYTIGAVFFGIGAKYRYIHSVWHFFVLAGSVLHYFSCFYSVCLP